MNVEIISQYSSIVGLALSIYLIILAAKVEQKIRGLFKAKEDVEKFNKIRDDLNSNFGSYQLNLSKDSYINNVIIASISQDICRFENCSSIITLTDRINIWRTNQLLLKQKLSKREMKKLLFRLNYFISRTESEEVFRYGK